MEKNKKKISVILASVLLFVAIAGALIFVVTSERKKSATAETIMNISVNPEIQIVLNQKDKVIDVKATNEDGDKLLSKFEFKGLTADEAAELFVKVSTEAGYIDVSSTAGTKVTITLSGNKEDYKKMQEKITTKVNSYFDENGIIAGAVTKVTDDIKTALEKVSADLDDIEEMTKAELVEFYAKHAETIDGVAYYQQKVLESSYETIKKTFELATSVMGVAHTAVKASITTVEAAIKIQSEELATKLKPVFDIAKAEDYEELQKALENAKKAVKETSLSGEMKESINNIISATQKVLDDMKETYETAKKKFEEDYKTAINEAITKSNDYLQSIKADFEARITEGTEKLNNRKIVFEANKDEIQLQINEYRLKLSKEA